jgi:hypothetical protein
VDRLLESTYLTKLKEKKRKNNKTLMTNLPKYYGTYMAQVALGGHLLSNLKSASTIRIPSTNNFLCNIW